MGAVGHKAVAVQVRFEEALAKLQRCVGVCRVEAVCEPRLFPAFDDERAQIGIEAIRVYGEPAVLRLLENERKCIERQRRAEPNETAEPAIELRRKGAGVGIAHAAIDTIGADQQIALSAQRFDVLDVLLKLELDLKRASALLENLEQPFARDAAEAVTPGPERSSFKMYF